MAALNTASSSIELANATRSTETIDCWAYELFFHLKYLQVNRARRTTDKVILHGNCSTRVSLTTNALISLSRQYHRNNDSRYRSQPCYRDSRSQVAQETESKPDDMIHIHLWHRLVQLRDNYIILYETLQNYEKIRDLESEKPQE